MQHRENKLLDILKYICAVLILASHCLPLVPNDTVNFYYGQWFFRFCVPLFLISSGYFFASFDLRRKLGYIGRIVILYGISALIYLPVYGRDTANLSQNLIFGYYHLWYLSALAIALAVLFLLELIPHIKRIYPVLACVLIVIGAFYDEYQFVFQGVAKLPFVKTFGDFIGTFGGSRHALFFALPMLLIGKFIFDHRGFANCPKWLWALLTAVSFGVSFGECVLLRHFGGAYITNDITLVNYFPAVFLLLLSLSWQPKALEKVSTKGLRKNADFMYVGHVLVMTALVDRFVGVYYLLRFVLTWALSTSLAALYQKITGGKKALRDCQKRLDRLEKQLIALTEKQNADEN